MRAADEHVAAAAVFFEDLDAVVGLAGQVGRHASAAIAELAGGSDGDAVAPEHADDRLAGPDLVFPTAPCEPDTERSVFIGGRLCGGREILKMHRLRRPPVRGLR